MAWYEIINAKSESFVADRDAEDLLRHLATALQTDDGSVGGGGVLWSDPAWRAPLLFIVVARGRRTRGTGADVI